MKTILILPFHGTGHYNALYGAARALQKSHKVVFAGTGFFYNQVVSKGFNYITLQSLPFGIGLEGWIHESKKTKNPKWRTIIDRWKDSLYHHRKAELKKLVEELKPDHVLIDAQQATDLIVIKAIDPKIRASIVTLNFPYLLIPGMPPANSLGMPGDNSAYSEGMKTLRRKKWKYWRRFLGMSDWVIVDRRLRKNNMMDMKDKYPSLIQFAAKGVEQYVFTYKEYDFHHPYLDTFKYVGPHLEIEYSQQWLDKLDAIKATGKKIVFCAFGSVPPKNNLDAFVAKVVDAIKDLNCELIVGSKPTWVPQPTILSRADVFITHGGINSIHEAIHFKVPMIVYPIDGNYDPRGNSSRVVYHGFGLRGDMESDSVDDIRRKLIEIFTDIRFRKNLESFDTSKYDIENFIKLITT